jgi:protein-tyrosine phosphatase
MSASTGSQPGADGIAVATPSREVVLEGCVNFRDLGGYRTIDGRQTRWRQVFRADGLNKLSPDDRVILTELGLGTVIDLRTRQEAEQRGSFPIDDIPVRYLGLPLTDVLPTAEELPDWKEASYVASHYFDMVVGAGVVLTEAIEALAAEGGLPAVMHCSAGKDRTGVLSALLLAFLGVPDETIVADYALSAAAMVRLLERLQGEYPESADAVNRFAPAILNVVPETMEQFLSKVRAEYGTYDQLAATLGVTQSVERLRATLLEPA